ncbi:uncharacterized protein G2W53_042146 [Senna tora]|uniref:Uncharacterized protein n=1 Tax=Senna tora TaxID=362788 RepID=A0A834SEW0_9FABA|nr:uncharacterized protein G2W53_042146 [Senna tora]
MPWDAHEPPLKAIVKYRCRNPKPSPSKP